MRETLGIRIPPSIFRFDWHDGEPNNFGHNENCLALREYHDPFL